MGGIIDIREGRSWGPRGGTYDAILDAAMRYSHCRELHEAVQHPDAKSICYFNLKELSEEAQYAFREAIRAAIPEWEEDETKTDWYVDSMKTFLRLLEGESPFHPYLAYERIEVTPRASWVAERKELDALVNAVIRHNDCAELDERLRERWPHGRVLKLHRLSDEERDAFQRAVGNAIATEQNAADEDGDFVESMKVFRKMLAGKAPQHKFAMYDYRD